MEVWGVLQHQTTTMPFKGSLPLCRNDANPPVFTVMCQPEQSLSQSSLFILSLFLSHFLWHATNFSVWQKITLLLSETVHGETAYACCSLSCKITNININTNKNNKTLANKFQAALRSLSQSIQTDSPHTFISLYFLFWWKSKSDGKDKSTHMLSTGMQTPVFYTQLHICSPPISTLYHHTAQLTHGGICTPCEAVGVQRRDYVCQSVPEYTKRTCIFPTAVLLQVFVQPHLCCQDV